MPEANRAHANFSEAERCFSAAAVLSMARSAALPAPSSMPANPPPESATSDNAVAGTHHLHIPGQGVRHLILKNAGDAARQGSSGRARCSFSGGKVLMKTSKMIMKNRKVIMV